MTREDLSRPSRLPAMLGQGAFTLVELLVSTAIMLVVILVLLEIITSMTGIWRNSSGNISNFEAARSAFTTLNRVVARATLKTYVDYVDNPGQYNSPFGNFRSSLLPTSQEYLAFVPYGFARASELHFLCGPATQFSGQTQATATANPGDAIFFQAPLGVVSTSGDRYLRRSLNNVGFYIQYGDIDTSILPAYLQAILGNNSHRYGFRLIQYVQTTENLSIYNYTSLGTYSQGWLPGATPDFNNNAISLGNSVMAENVLLLILRPRLEPQDESAAATVLGVTYNAANPSTTGSVISPNYNYDSRTWEPGYSFSSTGVQNHNYGLLMRNQLPPIVDVAMVCADPTSLLHLQVANSPAPPAVLLPPAGSFTKSDDADFNADLATFGAQLTAQHIRYKLFRSSVQIQGASWANQ